MEILKRAKGINDGELVAWNEKGVHEEVLRRSAKAGYTTRNGEPPYRTKIMITNPLGEERLNVWPRDENGNLKGE